MTMDTGGSSLQSEINITPMIDVLLVLLIIFMVIVPALPKGESVLAPKPSIHAPIKDGPDAVVLEVLEGARGEAAFRINQTAVSRADLPDRLRAIYANRAQRVLFVKGDDALSFTQIADAIDISHSAGVDRVGLITPKVADGL
jgi:biopolymer transport protein ExbD